MGAKGGLFEAVQSRKMKYYGHIIRNKGENLEKDIIQGTMPGKRRRGKPRTTWIDNIKDWTESQFVIMLRAAEDRTYWRKIAYNATNLRNEDG
jgi:hypothetical protein